MTSITAALFQKNWEHFTIYINALLRHHVCIIRNNEFDGGGSRVGIAKSLSKTWRLQSAASLAVSNRRAGNLYPLRKSLRKQEQPSHERFSTEYRPTLEHFCFDRAPLLYLTAYVTSLTLSPVRRTHIFTVHAVVIQKLPVHIMRKTIGQISCCTYLLNTANYNMCEKLRSIHF